MASITIRNLDDDVRNRLRVRTAGNGHSMEEEVRQILRKAVGRAERSRARATVLRVSSRVMFTLLDTKVVSELMRESPEPAVARWVSGHPVEDLFLSAVSEAELRYGAAILPVARRRETLFFKIDALLKDAGWYLTDGSSVLYEQTLLESDSTRSWRSRSLRPLTTRIG